MTALAGFKASVYVSTDTSTPLVDEAMTDVGGLHTTYQVTNVAHRYLDPTVPVVVQTAPDGVTWTTVTTGYTLQLVGGIVVFAVALTGATPSCRLLSGNWLTISQAVQAKTIEIQIGEDILDVTTFASGGWKTKIVGLGDVTYKMAQWWVDTFYIDKIINGNLMVVSAYSGANANQRIEGYALVKTDGIKLDVKAANEESLDFEGYGPPYYIAS